MSRPTSRTSRVLIAALAAAALALPITAASKPPTKKQRVAALRQKLKTLNVQKAETRADLQQTKRQQRRLSHQLNESYEALEQAQTALQQSRSRLQRAENELRAATKRLREAQERLKVQQRLFGRRIAASYKEGPVSLADVLLGARNISDFLDRQYYVSRITAHDAELLTKLREAQRQVELERERVLERKAALAAAHQDNEEKVARVAEQAEQRERLLAAIKQERALQEQRLSELEEDSNEVQGALAQELARRLANPGAYRNLPRWTGNLYKPARGRVTSGFGYRYHPVLRYRRLHAGIDIAAATGSPVYAAASGEVFFASWRGGYGRCIILLHGGEMSTLYAHLSRISVAPGQTVRRGQVIGAVGSTGLSTGPHLHFEVRRNGVPVNPF
jgi:murein DD-endopeptidase MepM/ murein hydrolase activator NlpD